MRSDPTFWLLARASGLTAYLLLTCSALAGLILKSRPFGRAVKAAPVMDLHRLLALLGLASLGLHGTALLLDGTVHMPIAGLFVPGSSPYRPVSVALGVVAAEVMALVVVSFSVRKLIGQRRWRLLHWSTYGIFGLATAHGLLAGSDSAQPWARNVYLGAVGAVAFATTWRALYRPVRRLPAAGAIGAPPPVEGRKERDAVRVTRLEEKALIGMSGAIAAGRLGVAWIDELQDGRE